MSSITKKAKQGVQPLAADDGILADSTSGGESPGVSEGDGPLRQADEAKLITTISGDGPEILRLIHVACRRGSHNLTLHQLAGGW